MINQELAVIFFLIYQEWLQRVTGRFQSCIQFTYDYIYHAYYHIFCNQNQLQMMNNIYMTPPNLLGMLVKVVEHNVSGLFVRPVQKLNDENNNK